jgi:hypothetical protein
MARRRIISDIAAMPVDEIKAELDAVQTEKTKLEMEEQLLAQMLRLREWESTGVHGAPETVAVTQAAAPERQRENVSANVLSLVRQAQEPLLPADVRDRLATQGIDADLNAVRVALRRWVDRGELGKRDRYYIDANAAYTLLSPNGGDTEE